MYTSYSDAIKYFVTVTANDSNGGIDEKKVLIRVLDRPFGANDTFIGNVSDIISTIPDLGFRINGTPFISNFTPIGLAKINITRGRY